MVVVAMVVAAAVVAMATGWSEDAADDFAGIDNNDCQNM